jgi:2-haloalkanoic acid dehalogenase type II
LTADLGSVGTNPIRGLLLDLLMAVMDSMRVWADTAGDDRRGLAWRDATTRRMVEAGRYRAYDDLVAQAASEVGLAEHAVGALLDEWPRMKPWDDVAALDDLQLPYAFVTNTSRELARDAAARSTARPAFVLSAEDAGWFKPRPEIYREACRRLETAPAETLFVAGSPYDARGALQAGLRAALVIRRPEHGVPDPRIAPFSSLHEIARVIDQGA